jgi:hypothetical protein
MTILKITVEDEQVDTLRKLLQEVSFVKSVEEEPVVSIESDKKESAVEQIKKILEEAMDKNLFKEIKDPVEWQRELRKEWDRDF